MSVNLREHGSNTLEMILLECCAIFWTALCERLCFHLFYLCQECLDLLKCTKCYQRALCRFKMRKPRTLHTIFCKHGYAGQS